MADSKIDWAGLASLANSLYGMYKGNQDPKFFKAPPTDAEQWALNARKDLYANDPTRTYIGEYAKQFMDGFNPNTNGFSVRDGRGGAAASFMGGMKFPTFDSSKFTTPGSKPQGPPASTVNPNDPNGIKGLGPETPTQQLNGPPGGAGGNDPFAGWQGKPNAQSYTWDDVKKVATQYGPEALKLLSGGSLIAMGVNGALSFLRRTFGGGKPEQQLPTSNTNRPIDALTPAGMTPGGPAYQQWLAEQQRRRDEEWQRNNDKTSGAQAIGQALGNQEVGSWGRFGRTRAK